MKSTTIVCLLIALFSTSAMSQTALLNRSELGPSFISDEYLEWDNEYDSIALIADSLCKRLDRMWVTGLISEDQRDKERGLILDLFHGEIRNAPLTILVENEDILKAAPLRRRLIIRRRNILRQIDQLESQALLSYGATAHLELDLKEDEPWTGKSLFPWMPVNSIEVGEEYPEDFEEATNEFMASIMPLLPQIRVENLTINIDTIETVWRRGLGYTMTAVINGIDIGVQELFPYGFHQDSTSLRYHELTRFTLPAVSLLNTWLKESSATKRLCSIQALDNRRPTGSWVIFLADERRAEILTRYTMPGVLKVMLPDFGTYGLQKDREFAFRELKKSGLLDRLGDQEMAQLKAQITLFGVTQESDYLSIASIYLLKPCTWSFHPEQITRNEIATYLNEVTHGRLQVEDLKVEFDPETESGLITVVTALGAYRYEGNFNEIRCGEEFDKFLREVVVSEQIGLTAVKIGPRRPNLFVSKKQLAKLSRQFPQTIAEGVNTVTY